MKTAISLPQQVFREAELFAQRTKRSRSELYRLALEDYIARHAPDRVTEAMNSVAAALGDEVRDDFTAVAARHRLGRSEW